MIKFLALICCLVGLTTASPSNEECTNYLYRGLTRASFTGRQGAMLAATGQVPQVMTCEAAFKLGRAIFWEFDKKGCSWGYANEVFYERILQNIGEYMDGECKLFGKMTDSKSSRVKSAYDSITCDLETEVQTAIESVVNCAMPKLMMAGPDNQPGVDICADLRSLSPCLEGAVDSCHNDNGEASDALLNLVMGVAATALKQVGLAMYPDKVQPFMDRFMACPDSDIGAFSRLKAVDLDYVPSPDELTSQEDIVKALNSGHVITPNQERLEGLKQKAAQSNPQIGAMLGGGRGR